jgi:DnaJ-domain-containing protein 1
MGLFFRKSLKFGPFRINLLKSGIGLSAGVKGARISTGPRGTHLNVGRKGIYYRQKISHSSSQSQGWLSRIINKILSPFWGTQNHSQVESQLHEKTGAERVAEFMRETNQEAEIGEMIRDASVVRTEAEDAKASQSNIGESDKVHEHGQDWRTKVEQATTGEHNQIFKRALWICVQKKRASTAVLQKEFDIGYEDAIAILDRMTEQGLIGKANGSRPRPILNLAFETIALWDAQKKIEEVMGMDGAVGECDELFEDALRICVEMKRASTSVLQRRLRIGYGRAAALLDAMEREGFIGQADGARPRPVLGRAYEAVANWDSIEQPSSINTNSSVYEILGLRPNASIDEITEAYHRTAKMYHPDKVASLAPEFRELAERRMKMINAAYQILIKQAR